MTGHAKDVEKYILKDEDKAYIAAIYFQEGTRPPGFTAETLKRCVSHVTNGMGLILSSLPDGCRITLEGKPLKSLSKEKTPSSKGRKKKKKKSPRTGGRKKNT